MTILECVALAVIRTGVPVTVFFLVTIYSFVSVFTLAEVIIPGDMTLAAVLTRILFTIVIRHFTFFDIVNLNNSKSRFICYHIEFIEVDNLGSFSISKSYVLNNSLEKVIDVIIKIPFASRNYG